MIPEDIHTTKLKITTRLRKYVEENIVVWYRYVKHTRGHDIENGDLRVVYGCRKSIGFGIATAFNIGRRENTRLSFLVEDLPAESSRCPYRWTHIGSAEVKAGSSAQSNVGFSSSEPVRNQCLFINTIDTKLSAKTWKSAELNTVMYSTPSPASRKPQNVQSRPTNNSNSSGSGPISGPSSSSGYQVFFHSFLNFLQC